MNDLTDNEEVETTCTAAGRLEQIVMRPPTEKPQKFDDAQYLLFIHWLKEDDRDETYTPEFFIALWEDEQWWIRSVGYEEDDDVEGEYGHILRPRLFEPLPSWFTLLGWAPLYGA